jgi:predicted alpha/beta superfamily hydrolase
MKKQLFFALFSLFLINISAQITLKITSLPTNTPAGSQVFVAGSFQNWSPNDANFKLTSDANGFLSVTFTPPIGAIEFKFSRGSWPTVEGNLSGGFLPNRTANYSGQPKTIELQILSWEDLGAGGTNPNSTAAWNVSILNNAFYMPQLNRNRRIWLYLPPDYATSTKYYPVLYMHDGQNLFDATTSFSGEWGVDETLNSLFAAGDFGCIVVGIDNGGAERLNEYSPWKNAQYGGGDGEKYTDFLVETLKPHIDANYRTVKDAAHTGQAGSSMGGLISMFGAIEHQSVFGKAGIFSPAFWFSDSCFTQIENATKTNDLRAYFVAGTTESTTMVPKMQQMRNALINKTWLENELFLKTDADGQHSEWYWKREFSAAYKFLFNNPPLETVGFSEKSTLSIFPNPSNSTIFLKNLPAEKTFQGRIFGSDGRLLQTSIFEKERPISVDSLRAGNYFLQLFDGEKRVTTLPFSVVK